MKDSSKKLDEISKELDKLEFGVSKLNREIKALKIEAEKTSKQLKEVVALLNFIKELQDAGK